MNKTTFQVPDRIAGLLRTKGTVFLGPTIVQCPGAWTRVGPTWAVPGIGWVVYGPGIFKWGTTSGLAQLCREDTGKTTMHATAWSTVPTPNLGFAVEEGGMRAKAFEEVASATAAAEAWWAEVNQ